MDENQPKIGKYSLNYGLILGAISVAFGVMLFTMDAHTSQDPVNTVINIVLMVGITIWGMISFRKANGGFLTLGEGVKLGVGIALVAAIIGVVYMILLANVLDTEFVTKIAENQKATMEASGQLTSEQIQQQYEGTINFFWISYPVIIIFNVIAGLVIGLIGGLILKKAKPAY
ncbi:MAG: DUF4199 domain-containing protein [Eudoraea sp.]|nr:DUF4199 domain-containing protein [Eudoraea sp.]